METSTGRSVETGEKRPLESGSSVLLTAGGEGLVGGLAYVPPEFSQVSSSVFPVLPWLIIHTAEQTKGRSPRFSPTAPRLPSLGTFLSLFASLFGVSSTPLGTPLPIPGAPVRHGAEECLQTTHWNLE